MNHHDKYLQEEVFRLSDTIKGSDLADLIKACQEPTAVILGGGQYLLLYLFFCSKILVPSMIELINILEISIIAMYWSASFN